MKENKGNSKNTKSNRTYDSGCSCQSSFLTRPHSDQTKGHANSSGPVYLQVVYAQQCLQDIKADSASYCDRLIGSFVVLSQKQCMTVKGK